MTLEEATSVGGILAAVVGAAFALIKFFFAQKEKIDDLQKQSIILMIQQLQSKYSDLSNLVDRVSSTIHMEIDGLKREVVDLKLTQASHISEMKTFGKAMLEVHNHFVSRDKKPESVKVPIGPESWIIKEKKRAEGEE